MFDPTRSPAQVRAASLRTALEAKLDGTADPKVRNLQAVLRLLSAPKVVDDLRFALSSDLDEGIFEEVERRRMAELETPGTHLTLTPLAEAVGNMFKLLVQEHAEKVAQVISWVASAEERCRALVEEVGGSEGDAGTTWGVAAYTFLSCIRDRKERLPLQAQVSQSVIRLFIQPLDELPVTLATEMVNSVSLAARSFFVAGDDIEHLTDQLKHAAKNAQLVLAESTRTSTRPGDPRAAGASADKRAAPFAAPADSGYVEQIEPFETFDNGPTLNPTTMLPIVGNSGVDVSGHAFGTGSFGGEW